MMEKVYTKDGSVTFYNAEYQESYHSITGAEEESLKKFVIPSGLPSLSLKQNLTILDICFGLGYNTASAIDIIRKNNKKCKIKIYALENDKNILNMMNNVSPNFNCYNTLRNSIHKSIVSDERIDVNLLLGDARKTIYSLIKNKVKVDIVFLDPFSPKKCPELWSLSFFRDIAKICNPGAVLTTYSCARIVRDNLISAGFSVFDGPCVGRRAPSTIAEFKK